MSAKFVSMIPIINGGTRYMQLDTMVPSYPEAGADTNLAMRRLVIKSVVESEHQYIAFLHILITVRRRVFSLVVK